MALEVPDQVRLVEPPQLARPVRPRHRLVHVDVVKQAAQPQDAGERTRAETDLPAELPVEVAVADTEPRRDISDRTGRIRRERLNRSCTIEGGQSNASTHC